jgi:hypothetical protein
MNNFIYLLFALLTLSSPVTAEWRYLPDGSELIVEPFAIATAEGGYHSFGVYCRMGAVTAFTQGYAAEGGAEQPATLSIDVDGSTFDILATRVPPDGFWRGNISPELVAALRRGNWAGVQPNEQNGFQYSLSGSSRAIDQAIADCQSNVSGQTSTPQTGPDFDLHATLQELCNGGYSLAEGSVLQGLIDDDDSIDTILDYAGIQCDDPSIGRGAGYCGINMCNITTYLSGRSDPVTILGAAPKLVPRAFGRSALRTIGLRPACPDGALDCTIDWRLTSTGLERVQ